MDHFYGSRRGPWRSITLKRHCSNVLESFSTISLTDYGENSNGKIINQALTVDRWRVKPKSRTRGMMMVGGKKAEVEDHDGIRRHGQTDRRWRERAPLRDTEGWPFRERVAGGGGGWSMQQQRHHRQHFHPRFPFAAYIPRFLFLPALSHGHSSGFLVPFLFYPFCLICLLPPSLLSVYYTHRLNVLPLHPSCDP